MVKKAKAAAKKAKSPPVAASPRPYSPWPELEPLMERQAKELQELHGSLKVPAQVYTTDEVSSFVASLRRGGQQLRADNALRENIRLREVSAVNGKIDRVSVLELPAYRERMRLQHSCRLIPVPRK